MNLYLISQDTNSDWDTYDSAIVAADNVAEARRTHPGGEESDYEGSWASFEDIRVRLIGEAAPRIEKGVVCASFNAG